MDYNFYPKKNPLKNMCSLFPWNKGFLLVYLKYELTQCMWWELNEIFTDETWFYYTKKQHCFATRLITKWLDEISFKVLILWRKKPIIFQIQKQKQIRIYDSKYWREGLVRWPSTWKWRIIVCFYILISMLV